MIEQLEAQLREAQAEYDRLYGITRDLSEQYRLASLRQSQVFGRLSELRIQLRVASASEQLSDPSFRLGGRAG